MTATTQDIDIARLFEGMSGLKDEVSALRTAISARNLADDERDRQTQDRARTPWPLIIGLAAISFTAIGAIGALSLAPLTIGTERNRQDIALAVVSTVPRAEQEVRAAWLRADIDALSARLDRLEDRP